MLEQPPAVSGSARGGTLSARSNGVAAHRSTPPRVSSVQLLGGAHEVLIEHAGQEYRLRLTRNDKLILTK